MITLRDPSEESVDIYPGLVVSDDRVTGSITVGRSRLPLWAIIWVAITQDWGHVESGWDMTSHYGYKADDLAGFLHSLLQHRGEFARLVLELAAAEQSEYSEDFDSIPWYENEPVRERVAAQLRRCLEAIEGVANASRVNPPSLR